MMPHVQELRDFYSSAGVKVLLVSREPADIQQAYLSENGYILDAAVDPGNQLQDSMGVQGLPTALLVSEEGKIIHVGFPSTVEIVMANFGIRPIWPKEPVAVDGVRRLLDDTHRWGLHQDHSVHAEAHGR